MTNTSSPSLFNPTLQQWPLWNEAGKADTAPL